jgi:NTE family protein
MRRAVTWVGVALIAFYAGAPLVALGWNALFGPIPFDTARNEPLGDCDPEGVSPRSCFPVERAREYVLANDKFPATFVGVALSGGGSRAANFSLAVMQELHALGLLQHVNAISSVSGGGLAGAAYALQGSAIDWEKTKAMLSEDLRGQWQRAVFYPHNYLRWLFTDRDRTDIMVQILDQKLFGHATYDKLSKAPGPRWLANASNITDGRSRFVFSEEEFAKHQLRLDTFPVAAAVMASGTFPAAFNSMTLRRAAPAAIKDPNPGYIHVIDGGPTDNLGVEALLRMARSHEAHQRERWKGCLIFVVDAHAVGVVGSNRLDADPRSWFDYGIDMNFMDAVDIQFALRRHQLLFNLGIDVQSKLLAWVHVEGIGNVHYGDEDRYGKASFANPAFDYLFRDPLVEGGAAFRMRKFPKPTLAPAARGEDRGCDVWHIALSGLMRLKGAPPPQPGQPVVDDPLLVHRAQHHLLVTQTKTDYRLKGPDGCSVSTLQKAIYEAAAILVRDDASSRQRACDWFARHKLDTQCDRPTPARKDVALKLKADAPIVKGEPAYMRVACAS